MPPVATTSQQLLGSGKLPSEPVRSAESASFSAPGKVAALALQLCVYRLRMYPVWPIIKVERLVASLQKPEPDIEVFALAYAVAAATIAQIRTHPTEQQPGAVTAEMMEAQCQHAKVQRGKDQPPDLTTVRIPFFLHIYYENLEPGGLRSITYLREAIAVAHMVGLHRESYYSNVQQEEQEIRRRTLWLLFVTERVVSIRHKLPVTLKTLITFPSTNDTDEREVLLAYHKLISMFWKFDQAGVFDLLDSQDESLDLFPAQTEALAAVRRNLEEDAVEPYRMNDMQALDILVTRQWMRVILWRLSQNGFFSLGGDEDISLTSDPVSISMEFLTKIDRMPESTVRDHGPALENKVFEIASSVVDAIGLAARGREHFNPDQSLESAREVLAKLQMLLGRNKWLKGNLQKKITQIEQKTSVDFNASPPSTNEDTMTTGPEFEQFQLDGFDFSSILGISDSPGTRSLTSDWSVSLSQSQSYVHSSAHNQHGQDVEPAWSPTRIPGTGESFAPAQPPFRTW